MAPFKMSRLTLIAIHLTFLVSVTYGRVLYPPHPLLQPQYPLFTGSNSQLRETPLPPPPECARIWDQSNGVIHFNLNQETGPLDPFNFIPVAVEMRSKCVLVTIDIFQKLAVYTNSTSPLPFDQCPIRYAFCESCLEKVPQSFSNREENSDTPTCAILYDSPFCSTTLGFAFEVLEDEKEAGLEFGLRRKVSSLIVRDGCALEIYDEDQFEGNAASVIGTIHQLEEKWDNQIVSFKCYCDGESESNSTESPTTSSPQIVPKPLSTTPLPDIVPVPVTSRPPTEETTATPTWNTTISPVIVPAPVTTPTTTTTTTTENETIIYIY